jgi:hypothetical protein
LDIGCRAGGLKVSGLGQNLAMSTPDNAPGTKNAPKVQGVQSLGCGVWGLRCGVWGVGVGGWG